MKSFPEMPDKIILEYSTKPITEILVNAKIAICPNRHTKWLHKAGVVPPVRNSSVRLYVTSDDRRQGVCRNYQDMIA